MLCRQIVMALALAMTCCVSGAMASDCQPSEWGVDDQIGAANRITAERIVAAAQLVKQGASHPLGIVITPGMPGYPPRFTQLQVLQPEHPYSETSNAFGWEASANDDLVQMWLGTGPQLDGLGHLGEAGEFYNCNRGKAFSKTTGLTKLDISQIPRGEASELAPTDNRLVEVMKVSTAVIVERPERAGYCQGCD